MDPAKNGRIDGALNGDIPITPMGETPETPAVDFMSEINPTTSGELEFPPNISAARVVYTEAGCVDREEKYRTGEGSRSGGF